MKLTEKKIRDVAGRSSTRSYSGGGGGGGVSAAWVDENYLSKEFFNQMFETKVRVVVTDYTAQEVLSDTTRVLDPNEIVVASSSETDPDTQHVITTTMTITDIQAKAGLWTQSFLSALGLNTGGGGGGATALYNLVDVKPNSDASPTRVYGLNGTAADDGKVLAYSATYGKWIAQTVQSGSTSWASITGKPTTISGYGITDAYISNGTIYLGSNSITPITSVAFSDLTSHPSTLSGYGITDAVGSGTKWWGQQISNGVVSGNMSSVGSIEMSDKLYMANSQSIQFKDSGGTYRNILTLNTSNQLAIGYNIRTQGYTTDIQGGNINFAVGTTRVEAMEISSVGRVWVRQGAQGLRIGDGLITWDSGNNALKVQRISSGSVVDGGLYATSFISALGANSSGGGGTSADSGLATSYTLPYTTSETYRYWHKLGTYQMDTSSMCLVIDLFTGDGYNGDAYRNSWARIMIKKGSSTTISSAVGVTCAQYGYPISNGKILVRINATAYNTGEVWVKCPWGWPKGAYSVQGNFTAWTHNNTTSGDSTSGPTHNQNDVGYYDNTSTMTTGE